MTLLTAARDAREHAYAPYSGFRVGAALRTDEGRVFVGVNVESAASGAGICAERSALAAAVTAGARRFAAVAVAGNGEVPCVPCGICRQALAEFAPDLEVVAAGEAGEGVRFVLVRDLLPHPFTR